MKTMTDNHIEKALRTVMERRAAKVPALADDFAKQVISKMNVRKKLRRRRFAAVFSIAAVFLIAFLLWPESHEEAMTQPKVQPVITEADQQPIPQPIIEEKKEETLAEVQATTPSPQKGLHAGHPSPKRLFSPSREELEGGEESTQPSHKGNMNLMEASYDEVDSRTQLYTAEIELEQSTHQRQKAYEKEMKQRALKLLLYINDREDELTDGTINTQKS